MTNMGIFKKCHKLNNFLLFLIVFATISITQNQKKKGCQTLC
jgi:hypothetical protein